MAPKTCRDSETLHPVGVSTSSHSISKSPATSSDSSHSNPRPPGRRITPVVRVVQIFAPKMIETDVANFRALVQELTGNSSSSDRDETVNLDKPRKGNGHKKREASRTEATPADRHEDAMAPVSAQFHNPVHQEPYVGQSRYDVISGAVQNTDGPPSSSCVQHCVDYAQSTAHQENAYEDARQISYSAGCKQSYPINRSYSSENSGYIDQCSLFSSDLDVLSSLNILSSSTLPELNQFSVPSELNQFAPISNSCHDFNSVLQQQFNWRLPVPPVFQCAYNQF